ncbi:MAG: hypothetical protein LBT37_04100 [Lactobacillaceae bacterium]|jgi:hypothetical protein|nr:hypothetical protein [Lactobacillaceae bacterium]
METLFELRHNADMLGENAKAENEKLVAMSADSKVSMEDLSNQESLVATANKRYDIALSAFKNADEKSRASLEGVTPKTSDPKAKAVNAYADQLRDIAKNSKSVTIEEFKQATSVTTGPENTGKNGGDNFLPITLGNEIISEPEQPNPLRTAAAYSTAVNLRLPVADVDFGEAWDVIADGDEAKEAVLKGSQITFGRFESKVRIGLTDTLMAGTNLALVQYAESKLTNAASSLEVARAFTTTPMTGEAHMSFYDSSNAIKAVNDGATMYEKIMGALADLSDADMDLASIFMTRKDFYEIVKELSNNSATLFGAAPETIFGVPVHFTSRAVNPVVGNFTQYQVNYDPMGSMIENYRKPENGTTYVQYTLWYDARIKRTSAFRIVGEAVTADSAPKA